MIATLVACLTLPVTTYWQGVDASFIPEYRDKNARFYSQAIEVDPLTALADAGSNLLRLRLWVNPPEGYCDLKHTLAMAKEGKARGMDLLLDFHYSDTWADPQHQVLPAAWANFSTAQLQKAVIEHSRNAVSALVAQGTVPRIVQVGNEVRDGMMWPAGRISQGNWANFVKFLKAGITGTKAALPKNAKCSIMIHHDRGADKAICERFFGDLKRDGVKYDMIGLSYYNWWHGPLAQAEENMNNLGAKFKVPVMVVETAYPFTLGWSDNTGNFVGTESQLLPGFPATPAGQAAFLTRLHQLVKAIPNKLGVGVVYWAPEYVATPGIPTPYENLCLFDFEHRVLPGASALGNP